MHPTCHEVAAILDPLTPPCARGRKRPRPPSSEGETHQNHHLHLPWKFRQLKVNSLRKRKAQKRVKSSGFARANSRVGLLKTGPERKRSAHARAGSSAGSAGDVTGGYWCPGGLGPQGLLPNDYGGEAQSFHVLTLKSLGFIVKI